MSEGGVIPRGYYRGRACGEPELSYTRSERAIPQIVVPFEFTLPDGEKRRLTWFGYLNDKNADRTLKALKLCGWRGTQIDRVDLEDLDREVVLDVREKVFRGRDGAERRGNEIAFINDPDRKVQVGKPMDDDAKSRFAADLAERARAIQEGDEHRPESEPVDVDDLDWGD